MIENDYVGLWNRCLQMIHDNVPETTFKTWFEPIVPLKYEDKALTIGVPSPFFYEILEEKFADLLRVTLNKEIEEGTVGVRKRGEGDIGAMNVDEFLSLVLRQAAEKVIF